MHCLSRGEKLWRKRPGDAEKAVRDVEISVTEWISLAQIFHRKPLCMSVNMHECPLFNVKACCGFPSVTMGLRSRSKTTWRIPEEANKTDQS